jgi:hypothetical protein
LQDLKKNPESQLVFAKVIADIVGAGEARKEALQFKQASEEMGRAEFYQWSAENPLSHRAAMHLGFIEQELAAPAVERGNTYTAQQKKFREEKQKIDDAKHDQWRKWQEDEKANNPQFARLKSKQEQAKRLKDKYSIPEAIGSIAKRLSPLPFCKRKNS